MTYIYIFLVLPVVWIYQIYNIIWNFWYEKYWYDPYLPQLFFENVWIDSIIWLILWILIFFLVYKYFVKNVAKLIEKIISKFRKK